MAPCANTTIAVGHMALREWGGRQTGSGGAARCEGGAGPAGYGIDVMASGRTGLLGRFRGSSLRLRYQLSNISFLNFR